MEGAHRSQLLPSPRNPALRRARTFIEGHGFTILSQLKAKNSICAYGAAGASSWLSSYLAVHATALFNWSPCRARVPPCSRPNGYIPTLSTLPVYRPTAMSSRVLAHADVGCRVSQDSIAGPARLINSEPHMLYYVLVGSTSHLSQTGEISTSSADNTQLPLSARTSRLGAECPERLESVEGVAM